MRTDTLCRRMMFRPTLGTARLAGAGDQEAPGIRQEVAKRLSNPDVQKAQQLSRDWKPGQSIPEIRPAAQPSPVPPLVRPERVRPERSIHSLPMCLAEPVAIPNVSTEVATARTMMAGECISKPSVPWMLSANGSGTPGPLIGERRDQIATPRACEALTRCPCRVSESQNEGYDFVYSMR